MSTRANITVKGTNVHIYKHFDGYPDEVLGIIEKPMKQFYNRRGDDPQYAVANLMKAFTLNQIEMDNVTYKDLPVNKDEGITESIFLSYGMRDEPFDCSFYYTVDLERAIIIVENSYGEIELMLELDYDELVWTKK